MILYSSGGIFDILVDNNGDKLKASGRIISLILDGGEEQTTDST